MTTVQAIDKMLQLSTVGITESLHQIGCDVVLSACASEEYNRRVLMNADHHCAFRTENFCPNIVSIERITAHFNIAERPTHKAQVNQSIVDITGCLKIFANEEGSFRCHTLHLTAHKPAGKVEVVDGHVENQ